MQQVSYQDAQYAVRDDFADSHTRYWTRLTQPGAWFTSQQRIDIAKEVRAARVCKLCGERKEALSPSAVSGDHDHASELSPLMIDVVHRITTDAARLSEVWYQQVLADGLSEGEYIEVVGTVVAMVSIDSFAIGIGVPLRKLPAAGTGIPSGYTPPRIERGSDAWVPMVPADNSDTPEADLWVAGRTGNVIRAMSLVPDEVRTLGELSGAHYLPHKLVREAGVDAGRALNRSQIEIVAGRVSALNECFY
jgi:hypothetical protein